MNCNQLFCGCDYYLGNTVPIEPKVYISIAFMLAIVAICVRVGSQWFIFKDYYPMKQRSPVLCIMMILCIAIQLIMYPLAYTYNYFTRNWGDYKYIYRTVFYAFDGSLYMIYLMRSLRLVYAHEVDISRSKTRIFKFFKHQYFLAGFLILVTLMKITPIMVFNSALPDENLFLTFIDINTYTFNIESDNQELAFGIKEIIHEFFWLSITIYCLWLQTLVHQKYSMKGELLFVLFIGFAINIATIGFYISLNGKRSIVNEICIMLPSYPILQLMRDLNVLGYFIVSIIVPLFKKRVQHMMLPTGRHHDIVKTMRDFLMESQFISIFQQYLKHRDEEQQTRYLQTLNYWKNLMVIKFKATGKFINNDQLNQCLNSIKNLIADIEEKQIKEIHGQILSTLKQSLLSFESMEDDQSEDRYKYLDQINQKIEQLQIIFLQKLDHIYKTEYRQTKSYYFLKMYMLRNKKININMISLGMAVMVESEDQL